MGDFIMALYLVIAAVFFGALLQRLLTNRPPVVPKDDSANQVNKQPPQDSNTEQEIGVHWAPYEDEETHYEFNLSGQKPIEYDADDTYDNFYMQREEEYSQEYGADFEDAIDDERQES